MNCHHYRKLATCRKRRLFVVFFMMMLEEVQRSCWVHPINLLRKQKGEFYTLYPDLRHYHKHFLGMYHMDVEKFKELLAKIKPVIMKKWTYMRKPISAEQKLVITLR